MTKSETLEMTKWFRNNAWSIGKKLFLIWLNRFSLPQLPPKLETNYLLSWSKSRHGFWNILENLVISHGLHALVQAFVSIQKNRILGPHEVAGVSTDIPI